MFLVILDTDGPRAAKYAEFKTQAAADAHLDRMRGRYSNAFVIPHPGGDYIEWRIDSRAQTATIDSSLRPTPPADPLTTERLFEILKSKNVVTDADRP